jgi:hypothetical protein
VGVVETAGAVVALPVALAGPRLAGIAGDRWSIRDGLTGLGVNPLLVEAFRDPCRDPYGDPCGDEARPAA